MPYLIGRYNGRVRVFHRTQSMIGTRRATRSGYMHEMQVNPAEIEEK